MSRVIADTPNAGICRFDDDFKRQAGRLPISVHVAQDTTHRRRAIDRRRATPARWSANADAISSSNRFGWIKQLVGYSKLRHCGGALVTKRIATRRFP
jgi:hypothetical protein